MSDPELSPLKRDSQPELYPSSGESRCFLFLGFQLNAGHPLRPRRSGNRPPNDPVWRGRQLPWAFSDGDGICDISPRESLKMRVRCERRMRHLEARVQSMFWLTKQPYTATKSYQHGDRTEATLETYARYAAPSPARSRVPTSSSLLHLPEFFRLSYPDVILG